jgi:CelD/BcsL family acetyltransferase involved in cellulose biosynthesis
VRCIHGAAAIVIADVAPSAHLALLSSPDEFAELEAEWNRLALAEGTPFLTHQWLHSWWQAFAVGACSCMLLRAPEGELLGGAVLRRASARVMAAPTNDYAEHWDVIAADSAARRSIWEEVGRLRADKLVLGGVCSGSPSLGPATQALTASGYRLATVEQQRSPYRELPGTWDELVAAQSRNHRSEIRRRRKRLEEHGRLALRTATRSELDQDLERFFKLEAAGWKGRDGTAVLQDPAAHELYTSFAHAAAAAGWLRLRFLDLEGVAVAADLSCAVGGTEFLLKTCFDESRSRLGPGAVLRAEALRAAINDGSRRYEFLGGPEPYKMRWGGDVRHVLGLLAYRRTRLPEFVYRHKLRRAAAALIRRRSPRADGDVE